MIYQNNEPNDHRISNITQLLLVYLHSLRNNEFNTATSVEYYIYACIYLEIIRVYITYFV